MTWIQIYFVSLVIACDAPEGRRIDGTQLRHERYKESERERVNERERESSRD